MMKKDVKTLRTLMGLSQAKFGNYFGIPVANIQRWEQGVAKPCGYVVDMMWRIHELETENAKKKSSDSNEC